MQESKAIISKPKKETLRRVLCAILLTLMTVGPVSALSTLVWGATPKDAVRYALLIGIDTYPGNNISSLKGAKNDVNLMADILAQRFEFKAENINRLVDQNATHTNIKKAFEALIRKAKAGDTVYIHYSGHGSYICDLNGDESSHWGKDSTWVSYGARSKGLNTPRSADCDLLRKADAPPKVKNPNLDEFDVLDDEINAWLTALGTKTDQIIFVSDSCHSGTVTRGLDAVRTRAIPADIRFHPLGKRPVGSKSMVGLRITACRDDELASEYQASGRMHGAFTWFWGRSLMAAKPHESWGDIFKRARTKMRYAGGLQHPQIEGPGERPAFGGEFSRRPKTIVVKKVSADGRRATIEAGSLVGVTVGSIYIKHDPQTSVDQRPTLKIARTRASISTARVNGVLKVGDLVTLAHYKHPHTPLKAFVVSDLEDDRHLVRKIKEAVTQLPAYDLTDNQSESDLVLRVLRPERDQQGDYRYEGTDHALPKSSTGNKPECWVLTPEERLYQEKLRLPMDSSDKALHVLYANLEKIARIRNMVNLAGAPGHPSPIDLAITVWREDELGDPATRIEADKRYWQPIKKLNAEESELYPLIVDQMLTFGVHNRSGRGYYIYLVDITADGQIIPFYPTFDQSKEAAYVPGGGSLEVDIPLLMNAPGQEYIRLIASREPIDIYLLEQKGYKTRAARTRLNPLEALLCAKAGLTRGNKDSRPIGAAEWTTLQAAFEVSKQ